MIFRGDKLTQKVYFTHFKDISSFTHGHSETEKKKKRHRTQLPLLRLLTMHRVKVTEPPTFIVKLRFLIRNQGLPDDDMPLSK